MSEQDNNKRLIGPEEKLADAKYEALEELTEVLAQFWDDVKMRLIDNSIHTEFRDFLRIVTSNQEITKAQYFDMKVSFYAGAMTLMGMFKTASEELEEEEAAWRVSDLMKEIVAFFDGIPQQFEDPTQPPIAPEEEEEEEEEETKRRQFEALKMMPKESMGEA